MRNNIEMIFLMCILLLLDGCLLEKYLENNFTNTFKYGPKVWQTFVENIIHIANKGLKTKISMSQVYPHFLQKAKSFKKKSLQEHVSTQSGYPFCSKNLKGHRYCIPQITMDLSGFLNITPQKCQFFDRKQPTCSYWYTNLHRLLALKMEFSKFSIKLGLSGYCMKQQTFFVTSLWKSKSFDFFFCGVMPAFVFFPPNNFLKFGIYCDPQIENNICTFYLKTINIQVFFSLTDTCRKIHKKFVENSNNWKVEEIWIPSQNWIKESFRIVVAKARTILLNLKLLPAESFHVWDGPDKEASQILSDSGSFETTTFQAYFTLYIQRKALNFKENILFSEKQINEALFLDFNRTDFSFKQSNETSNPQYFKILNQKYLSLNISINSIHFFEILESYQCRYGGLVIIENIQKELISLCSPDNSETSLQKRNIYSSEPHVLMMFYWYKAHEMFDAKISIQETNCHSVHFDPCKVNRLCPRDNFSFQSIQDCRIFMNTHESSKVVFPSRSRANPKTDQCLIFQIWPNTENLGKKCFLKIMDQDLFKQNKSTEYHIKGSLARGFNKLMDLLHFKSLGNLNHFEQMTVKKSNKIINVHKLTTSEIQYVDVLIRTYFTRLKHIASFEIESPFTFEFSDSFWVEIKLTFFQPVELLYQPLYLPGLQRYPFTHPCGILGHDCFVKFFFVSYDQIIFFIPNTNLSRTIFSLWFVFRGNTMSDFDIKASYSKFYTVFLPFNIFYLQLRIDLHTDLNRSGSIFLKGRKGSKIFQPVPCPSHNKAQLKMFNCFKDKRENIFSILPRTRLHFSWNDAKNKCNEINATLPQINNEFDLENFRQLLRIHPRRGELFLCMIEMIPLQINNLGITSVST